MHRNDRDKPRRRKVGRQACLPREIPGGFVPAGVEAIDNDLTIVATIVDRQPDTSYPEGLSTLADVLVLHMFDSGVGETLRMAYTIVQEHQERQNRRATLSVATEALREHLARLDETLDEL
jgi:hypothetical protein